MAEDVFGIVGSLQAAVFRVERVVAEGGFGVVYRAHHEGFKAPVALKCLKIPGSFTLAQRQAFLQKFQEEGEVLFRLSALIPSVVRPLHVGTLEAPGHPFVPFIALEWLDGDSLEALVERRRLAGKPPLDLVRVARMMGPVARGLECAHRFPGAGGATLSILHRDLKPENLLLARQHGQDALKILDFGIGKVRSAATQIVGRVSAEQGDLAAFTPAYGAPEQWLPKRFGQTGPWTDVWGFALCAVYALTAKAPLEGDAAAVMGACIDAQRRPTPGAFGVVLPERAEAAFRKALAVDPAERFHDIGEFWDEIEAAAGQRTPRITSSGLTLDSMLPPAEHSAAAASSRSPDSLDATERMALPARFPELTLGFEPPDLVGSATAERAEPAPPLPQLSVMPKNSLEQLTTADSPRGVRRGAPARAHPARQLPSEAPTVGSVMARLLPALRLIGVGVAITIADITYATVNGGQPFTLGPVRALWIAGPLVGLGVVKLVLSLIG
jgi:serine/threonine-protein kinase